MLKKAIHAIFITLLTFHQVEPAISENELWKALGLNGNQGSGNPIFPTVSDEVTGPQSPVSEETSHQVDTLKVSAEEEIDTSDYAAADEKVSHTVEPSTITDNEEKEAVIPESPISEESCHQVNIPIVAGNVAQQETSISTPDHIESVNQTYEYIIYIIFQIAIITSSNIGNRIGRCS